MTTHRLILGYTVLYWNASAGRDSTLQENYKHPLEYIQGNRCTWAHISHGTNGMLSTGRLSRREPKVREKGLRPVLVAQDI